MASPATDLIEYLVRAIVEEPEAVEVSEFDEGDELILEVKVADSDLGRVIGREGRVAKSIRTIARAAGAREERRISVDIVED